LKTIQNLFLLGLLLFLLSWWSMSSLAFYNSDAGLRYWQVRELVANNRQSFAIEYPGRVLDPDYQFIPLYCAYTILQGQVFFPITPFLPYLSSFFYTWLDIAGLAVVPVFAGVMTAFVTYKLATLSNLPRPRLILWSSVLATPLLFYTIQLWDHSLAMACAVWAVYGVALGITKQRWQHLLWAGVVAALGMGQRPEMYMFALALGIALLIVAWPKLQPAVALAVGGVLGMLPIMWLQYRWTGHPLGVLMTHVSDYGKPDQYVFQCIGPPRSVQAGRFLLHVDGQDPWSFTAALLAVGGLFLLIFWLRLPRLQHATIAVVALAAILGGYAIWGTMLWQGALAGLLTSFPLLGLSLTYIDGDNDRNANRSVYHLTLLTALIFITGMIAFWPAYGGVHWGGRYLLPVYPLLIFLAFYVYYGYAGRTSARAMLRFVALTLLILSIILQLMSLRLFWRRQHDNTITQTAIANLPAEVILTNHPFLPTMLMGLEGQFFMYIDSETDFDTLIPRLQDQNITRFAFISVAALPLSVPSLVGSIEVKQISPMVYELVTEFATE
jgi:hypothetical protein